MWNGLFLLLTLPINAKELQCVWQCSTSFPVYLSEIKGVFCDNVGILYVKINTTWSLLHPRVNKSKAKLTSSEGCWQIAEHMQTGAVLGPLGLMVLFVEPIQSSVNDYLIGLTGFRSLVPVTEVMICSNLSENFKIVLKLQQNRCYSLYFLVSYCNFFFVDKQGGILFFRCRWDAYFFLRNQKSACLKASDSKRQGEIRNTSYWKIKK